jgi:hypothetical protein
MMVCSTNKKDYHGTDKGPVKAVIAEKPVY